VENEHNDVTKWGCECERELVSMSLWVGMNIFGIFQWWGQYFYNIFMPCRNDMEIFFHMYMDEIKMDEKFGWKLNINEFFEW
jgi:hypothetical protein